MVWEKESTFCSWLPKDHDYEGATEKIGPREYRRSEERRWSVEFFSHPKYISPNSSVAPSLSWSFGNYEQNADFSSPVHSSWYNNQCWVSIF